MSLFNDAAKDDIMVLSLQGTQVQDHVNTRLGVYV